jgi:hypothetical protein
MEDNQTYLLKEFDKLNAEIAKLLEETRSREKYSLTIIAVVSAWIYKESFDIKCSNNHSKDDFISLIHTLSWIPLITTFFYGISVLFLYKNIKWIGQYLLKIENIFLDNFKDQNDVVMGWEKYFEGENRKKNFVIWTQVFWILQILIAILVVYKSYNLT